jgi:hypothetical protein
VPVSPSISLVSSPWPPFPPFTRFGLSCSVLFPFILHDGQTFTVDRRSPPLHSRVRTFWIATTCTVISANVIVIYLRYNLGAPLAIHPFITIVLFTVNLSKPMPMYVDHRTGESSLPYYPGSGSHVLPVHLVLTRWEGRCTGKFYVPQP